MSQKTLYCKLLIFLTMLSADAVGQKKAQCPDGEHIEIDLKRIAIEYDASSFAGTLSSLSVLGGRMEVAPKKLQEAATATQQWDVFLKGLAEGYNKCAVSRAEYVEGLNRIYPRLKEDAASLEEIRRIISNGQKAEAKHLQGILDSYYSNLQRFARIAGQDIIVERIETLAEQIRKGQDQLRTGQAQLLEQQQTDTERILEKLKELEERNKRAPLSTPKDVDKRLTEIKRMLLTKTDEAEAAYNKGFELLQRYRFQEAIPFLQQALAAVSLPDFYLALGEAYREVPNLAEAESVLRRGLEVVNGRGDTKQEADLANLLGIVLEAKGDLEEALSYSQRALKIDEKVYGPDHPNVARDVNNIGQIFQDKGDLEEALSYSQRALKIDEKVYGPDHPNVAIRVSNIGQIFQDKGDLERAFSYSQRALKIDEKVYGPDHPNVAIDLNNIGQILKANGDLEGALSYSQRALKIDEKVYGPDHPKVAIRASNIGMILQAKGDLEEALSYSQRALKIDEKVYGPNHPDLAIRANNIGQILQDKGDLEGALSYSQRALKIDEKVYGPDHPSVAILANNIGTILKDKGDLEGALRYTQRALRIFENSYGPQNPTTKTVAANLQRIEQLQNKH